MEKMIVHFTLEPGMDAAEVQKAIKDRFAAVHNVEVQVGQDTPRLTGVEVAAAIAVGIVIVRDSGKLAEEVLDAVRSVLKKYHALKAEFEVGRKRISANEAKPADIRKSRAKAKSGE
ncbi:MAG: hypothetical protein WB586_14965 [Chthoniobacterales bacterium]